MEMVGIQGSRLPRRHARCMAARKEMDKRIREGFIEAFQESKIDEILDSGVKCNMDKTAGAALKTVLAQKAAEYTIKAISIARKRRMRFGAAAIVLAVKREE